jgi:hypothetical protein
MTSVTTDHQSGADHERAVRYLRAQPYDPSVLFDQVCRLSVHAQLESFVALTLLSHEIKEIPLRHQRDEFAVRWEVAEIHHLKALGADLTSQRLDLLSISAILDGEIPSGCPSRV